MKFLSSFSLIASAALVLSGCSSVQQWLAPECECEIVEVPSDADDELARTAVDQQIEHAHDRAQFEERQAARGLEGDQSRGPDEFADEPVDPWIEDSIVAFESDEERREFADRHSITVPPNASVYRGHFESGDHITIAVHHPGESLEIYREGSRIATLSLEQFEHVDADAPSISVGAVDLVRDGTAQLKLIHARIDDDDEITYHVGVYKMIAGMIGTIFRKPIAETASDGSIHRRADLRYLHGTDQRIIEWLPLDAEGNETGESVRYAWNHWEGVYRIPKPPPTASTSEPQS